MAFDIYCGLSSLYHSTDRWSDAEGVDRPIVAACRRIFGVDHPRTLIAEAELVATVASLGQQETALRGVAHAWSALMSGALEGDLRLGFLQKYGPIFHSIAKNEPFAQQIESAIAEATASNAEDPRSFDRAFADVMMTCAGHYAVGIGRQSFIDQREEYLDYLTKRYPGIADQGLAREEAITQANRHFLEMAHEWASGLWSVWKEHEPWLDDVEQRRLFCRGAFVGLINAFQSVFFSGEATSSASTSEPHSRKS